MIRSLDSGRTTVPESDRNEWPVIVLMAYLEVEPDPLDRRNLNRLFEMYHPGGLTFYQQLDRAWAIQRLREPKSERAPAFASRAKRRDGTAANCSRFNRTCLIGA